jgi:rubrerythrin
MTYIRTITQVLLVALLVAVLQTVVIAADGPNFATLERLQAAHRVETIAQERYMAFAAKADEEGYGQVASLFRAIARSEQILYNFHFDAIKELGGTPEDVAAENPAVGSTKENLEKVVNKSGWDQLDSDYATYIKTARAEGNRNAAKTFEYARQVEAQNFRLLAGAFRSLEQMRGGPKPFYLCGVSGFVSPKLEPASCAGPDWEKVK